MCCTRRASADTSAPRFLSVMLLMFPMLLGNLFPRILSGRRVLLAFYLRMPGTFQRQPGLYHCCFCHWIWIQPSFYFLGAGPRFQKCHVMKRICQLGTRRSARYCWSRASLSCCIAFSRQYPADCRYYDCSCDDHRSAEVSSHDLVSLELSEIMVILMFD